MLQIHTQSKDLQIVGPIASTSSPSSSPPPFQLPTDWVSELRPRKDGRFDKYYYEPGTGRQFRSLSSIQKYLSGDIDSLAKRLKNNGRENPSTMLQIQTQSKDLQIVGPITATSSSSLPFQLPDDWVSKLCPRKDGRFDKYYYEPGTGKQFRSLSSIQKYLNGDIDKLPKSQKHNGRENIYYEPGTGRKFRSLSSVQNYLSGDMAIGPSLFKRDPSFRLPKGWVVKKKLRNSANYEHRVDRIYIEPGTGRKFRSLLSVERHIAETKGKVATLRSHQLYLTDKAEASNTPRIKNEASVINLGKPPARVKWVLSPVGSIWKPFVNDSLVSDSLKSQWSQASEHILSYGH